MSRDDLLFCISCWCFRYFSFSFILLFSSLGLKENFLQGARSGICGQGNKHPYWSATVWRLILYLGSQENRAPVNILLWGLPLLLPKCHFYPLALALAAMGNNCLKDKPPCLWFPPPGLHWRKTVKWFIPPYMRSCMDSQVQSFGLWSSMFLG